MWHIIRSTAPYSLGNTSSTILFRLSRQPSGTRTSSTDTRSHPRWLQPRVESIAGTGSDRKLIAMARFATLTTATCLLLLLFLAAAISGVAGARKLKSAEKSQMSSAEEAEMESREEPEATLWASSAENDEVIDTEPLPARAEVGRVVGRARGVRVLPSRPAGDGTPPGDMVLVVDPVQ